MNKIDKPSFYKNMIVSGSNNLYNYYPEIDKLNVFPVPDGDTGTNLNLTISNAIIDFDKLPSNYSFKELSDSFSYNLIMNARGNSGVIFSQIFKGIGNAISKTTKYIDFLVLSNMFKLAKEVSYKAVMKPVEGTILTIVKDISNFLIKNQNLDKQNLKSVFKNIIIEGNKSLKNTTELLPILKEVGVVDSGAFGLVRFLEGMSSYLFDKKIIKKSKNNTKNSKTSTISLKNNNEFGYCTEVIVTNKDATNFNTQNIRNALKEQEKNNSIIVVTDKDIMKIHVHTLNPGNVLIYLQQFGSFKRVKIDNMTEQVHQNTIVKKQDEKNYDKNLTELLLVLPNNKLGKYFSDELKINNIIYSTSDRNISTQEFINSVKEINAKNVIILPNDSNSILAAQNSVKLIDTEQQIYVLPTKNIQEGLLVSRLYDCNETYRKNWSFLKSILNDSISISVHKSDNNGKNNGFIIKKNDYVALQGNKVIANNSNIIDLLYKIFNQKINKYSEMVTLIKNQTPKKSDINLISKYLDENFDVEYEYIDGNLETYDYLLLIQ